MSRSNPTQAVLPFAPPAPKPIPHVDISAKPPEGMRWLGIGEHFEEQDQHIGRPPHVPIHPGIIGQRVTKRDVGRFARWFVLPEAVSLMENILKKKK